MIHEGMFVAKIRHNGYGSISIASAVPLYSTV